MLNTTVDNIMTEHVVTLSKEATITIAAHILLRFQINGLLVVDKKNSSRVIGVFTTTDLLRLLDRTLSKRSRKMLELARMAATPIGELISGSVTKIQKGTKLAKVIVIMHRKNVHTLPVYDGKKLIGVVGRHDILNAAFYTDKP